MRILQILPMYHSAGEDFLQQHAEVICIDTTDPSKIIPYLRYVDAVILRAPGKVTQHMIEEAGSRLKVISGAGVGLDNIDIGAATKKGIAVLHAPKLNAAATAEHAFTLILSLFKKIVPYHDAMTKGNFESRNQIFPHELNGKTCGLIGWGEIARRVASLAKAIDMDVKAYVRNITDEKEASAKKIGVELTTNIKDVFAGSDVVSLHIPLTEESRGLVNQRLLDIMKPTAYIVNTSRGGVVDESALISTLRARKIAGAGLDVFTDEPPEKDNPLLSFEHVISTPHIGGITEEAARETSLFVAKQMVDYLKGDTVHYIANPEVE